MCIHKTLAAIFTKNEGANPPAPRAAPEYVTFNINVMKVQSSNNFEFFYLEFVYRISNLYL
jgi:hypothetical protein